MPRSDMQLPPAGPRSDMQDAAAARRTGGRPREHSRSSSKRRRRRTNQTTAGPRRSRRGNVHTVRSTDPTHGPQRQQRAQSRHHVVRGLRVPRAHGHGTAPESRRTGNGTAMPAHPHRCSLCIMIDGVWTLERPAPSERAGLQGCVSCGRRSDPGRRRRRIRASSSDWFALHDEMGV